MTGIVSFGGYIPRLRLQRKSVATANAWFAPNLMGSAKGERSMANWDEDAITMAVEAGRDCLPGADPLTARAHVDAIYFASTTAPFADRQNAGVIAAALSLPETISATDIGGSQRAATSALIAALNAMKAGSSKHAVVLASEKGAHIATVFLVDSVSAGARRIIAVVAWTAVALLYAVLVRATWRMLDIVHDERSPILQVPGSVTYVCVLVGMVLIAALAVLAAWRAWRCQRVAHDLHEPGAQAAQG